MHLAACAADQSLPLNADLPADLFTSCLTTPIRCALHVYLINHRRLHGDLPTDVIERMPGKVSDKSSVIGELHWIFTAVTDTIAWSSLDRHLFQKLFRQDLLVASLCRNYLLACRLMRLYQCTPVCNVIDSSAIHAHMLWDAWEHSLDICLSRVVKSYTFMAKAPALSVSSRLRVLHASDVSARLRAGHAYDERSGPAAVLRRSVDRI